MVRKIDKSKGRTKGLSDKSVEAGKAITSKEVGQTGNIRESKEANKTQRVRQQTRPMSPDERANLLKLIQEEADKMFGPNGLPESQRSTVEKAVRMAIDASIVDEEDEEDEPPPAR